MRSVSLLAAAALVAAVAGCNPSLVKKGDPLYAYVQHKTYYLARPLSGPRWRNDNVFGTPPILAAGTEVTVTGIERSTPIYRISFSGPKACKPTCQTHWREPSDAAFKDRFQAIFHEKNPVDALGSQMKTFVTKHQVAQTMSPKDLLLTIGAPNRYVSKGDTAKWIYERRACDATGRLLAMPKLALDFKNGKLEKFEQLDSSKWYVTKEPVGKLTSLCEGVKQLPGDVPVRPAQAGEMSPGANPDTPQNTDMGGSTSSSPYPTGGTTGTGGSEGNAGPGGNVGP